MAERIRRHVRISGRVQGVWFRDCTRRMAEAHGLAGWVRNCADGTVEAVFEGPRDAVEAAVDWCRTGPPRAEVASVSVEDEEPEALSQFRIT